MVKGISKRVVVLKMEKEKIFEEAIFIVRSDAFAESGYSREDILREAKRVAEDYAKKNVTGKRKISLPAPFFAAAGAAATTVAYIALRLIGV